MAYGIIKDGVIINTVEASQSFGLSQGWVLLPENVGIGWQYDGTTFSPPNSNTVDNKYSVPTYLIRQRAEKIGIWDDLSAYLVQYPALMLKTLTLEEGIDPKDPDLIKGFTDLSMPQSVQDYLLSDPSLGV